MLVLIFYTFFFPPKTLLPSSARYIVLYIQVWPEALLHIAFFGKFYPKLLSWVESTKLHGQVWSTKPLGQITKRPG